MRKKKDKKYRTYIRGIADELTEKNLLVAVEGVDDQTQELVDLSLESERFNLRHLISALGLRSLGL